MSNASRVWILGASGPEMGVIETILRACGEKIEYALARGERVSPKEAHCARLSRSADLRGVTEVYLVGCDLVGNEIAHVDSIYRVPLPLAATHARAHDEHGSELPNEFGLI